MLSFGRAKGPKTVFSCSAHDLADPVSHAPRNDHDDEDGASTDTATLVALVWTDALAHVY